MNKDIIAIKKTRYIVSKELKKFDNLQYTDDILKEIAIRESIKKSPGFSGKDRETDVEYVLYTIKKQIKVERDKITNVVLYLDKLIDKL
jgi:hypothetical protein